MIERHRSRFILQATVRMWSPLAAACRRRQQLAMTGVILMVSLGWPGSTCPWLWDGVRPTADVFTLSGGGELVEGQSRQATTLGEFSPR